MSRKDYILIASILNQVRYERDRSTIDRAIDLFCDALVKDNPNFNRNKFINACKET